mmetsp:Transcript_16115/g.18252  ORF Transcript_16115/g.18252 Transcript_16115/m.18252 type:complete len:394 (+) Transcript_16115:164-1345(+)
MSGEKELADIVDHPSFSTDSTPARFKPKNEAVSTGAFDNVPESERKGLKVFDDLDNQLNLEDLDRTPMKCFTCGGSGEYVIASVDIPYFGKAEILSFGCDDCGYKMRKVKSGLSKSSESTTAKEADTGTILTVEIKDEEDLQRQIIRSDTAKLSIPAIDFESETADGVFTTVEGLILGISTSLSFAGIVSDGKQHIAESVSEMCSRLISGVREGNSTFEIVLDDPYSDCFIQPRKSVASIDEDKQISVQTYSRVELRNKEIKASKHLIPLNPSSLLPGMKVQAKWETDWIPNCTIVNFMNEDRSLLFVAETGKENEGGWQVGLESVRSLDGQPYSFTTRHEGNMSTEEMMEKLNIMAEHVEMEEENARASRRAKEQKEKEAQEQEIIALNELD